MNRIIQTIVFSIVTLGVTDTRGAEVPRPNIVIFHSHDFGQYLHCYGVSTVQTPNLDKFAEQGVRFARSFCTNPGCSPSRASLFTGRYPHSNGVMGLTHSRFGWDLHPEEKHLAQLLKEAGYETVGIGVIHETRSGPERCGAHERTSSRYKRPRAPRWPFRSSNGSRSRRGLFFSAPVLLIRTARSGLQSLTVRSAWTCPVTCATRRGRARNSPPCKELLLHLDKQFGRLMQTIQELGLETNTLVIVTTDHGIGMPRAKCSVHDPGLQVALLLRYAGRKGWCGGLVRNELVSNIDVLPSILELAGIPIAANVQGRSFAPLLDGRPYIPNAEIFGELTYHNYYDPERSIRTETNKLIAYFWSAPTFMDPSQQWRPKSDAAESGVGFHPYLELYDLTTDPWELTNVATDSKYAQLCSELERRLYQHMVKTDDPLLRGAVTSPQHDKTLQMLREAANGSKDQ